jgi:hypothetical protein
MISVTTLRCVSIDNYTTKQKAGRVGREQSITTVHATIEAKVIVMTNS